MEIFIANTESVKYGKQWLKLQISKAPEAGGFHGGYLLLEQSKNVSGKRDFELPVVVVKYYNPAPNERYPVIVKNNKGTNLIISNDELFNKKKAEAGLQ